MALLHRGRPSTVLHFRRGTSIPTRNVVTLCFLPYVALTDQLLRPRWLIEHGQFHNAKQSLHWLREGSFSTTEIEDELSRIQDSVEEHKASGRTWLSLFKDPDLFNRLWRASLLQFMAQMCGATAMKYYLPTLLGELGVPTRITLLIGGIESTVKIGMTIVEMLIIDKVGRRATLVAGSAAMSAGMLVSWLFLLATVINELLRLIFPDQCCTW